MSDLKLSVRVGFDAAELTTGIASITKSLSSLSAHTDRVAVSAGSAGRSLDAITAAPIQRINQQIAASAQSATADISASFNAYRQQAEAASRAATTAAQAAASAQSAAAAQAAAAEEAYLAKLRQTAAQHGKTQAEIERLKASYAGLSSAGQAQAAQIGASMEDTKTKTAGAAEGFTLLRGSIVSVVALKLASWALEGGKAITYAQIQAETLQKTLSFANFGGSTGADMAWLQSMTNKLGLEFNSTATAFASFAAATRNTSIGGEKAKEVFESVSIASSKMGLSADRTNSVFLALTQMVSKGTISAEEFKQQLGEHLPIAMEALEKSTGKSTAELLKMMSSGELLTSKYLPEWAAALREMSGSVEGYGDSTQAAVNKASNAWTQLMQTLADSGGADAAKSVLTYIADLINDVSTALKNAKLMGGGFLETIRQLGGVSLGKVFGKDIKLGYVAGGLAGGLLSADPKKSPVEQLQDRGKKKEAQILSDKQLRDVKKADWERENAEKIRKEKVSKDNASRFKSYLEGGNAKGATKKEQQAKKIEEINADFRANVENYKKGTAEYNAAVKARDARLAEAAEKSSKGGSKSPKIDTDAKAYADLVAQLSNEKKLGEDIASSEAKRQAVKYSGFEKEAKLRAEAEEKSATASHRAALLRQADKAHEIGQQQKENALATELRDLKTQYKKADDTRRQDLQNINDETERELSLVGSSAESRAASNAAWEVEKSVRKEVLALQERQAAALGDEAKAEIDREIAAVKANASELTAAKKRYAEAQATGQEWQRVSQDIERGLTDALMRGFESGKGFMSSLRDYIVNAFNTTVVKMIVQPVIGGINAVGGALWSDVSGGNSSGGGSGAGAGGGSGMSSLSTLGSMTSMIGSNSIGKGLQQGAIWTSDAIGGATNPGAVSGMLDTAAGNAANYTNIEFGIAGIAGGIAGNYIGNTLFDGKGYAQDGGSLGGSAGATIGMVMGGPIGAAIGGLLGSAAGGALGSLFGPERENVGGNYMTSWDALGGQTGQGHGAGFTNSQKDTEVATVLSGMQTQYAALVKDLGGTTSELMLSLGYRTDPNGTSGNTIRAQVGVGGDGAAYTSYHQIGDDVAGEMKLEAAKMMVAALRGSNIKKEMADELNKIDLSTATEAQIASALAAVQALYKLDQAFKGLAYLFPQLSDLSLTAKQSIAALSGGLDALSQNLANYRENYYSQAERDTATRSAIADELQKVDIALPETRAQYRALVESLDLNTTHGQAAYAKLMELSGAFASVSKATEEVTKQYSAMTLAFEGFSRSLPNLSTMSQAAQLHLVALAGSLETLASNIAGYKGKYFTKEEQSKDTMGGIQSALSAVGLSVPASVSAFRELADSLDQSKASGRLAYAAMMSVASAFYDVMAPAAAATDAVSSTTSAIDAASTALSDFMATLPSLFATAAAEAEKTLASIKTAQKSGRDVDRWLAKSSGNENNWNDTRRAELWAQADKAISPEQELATLQELQGLISDRYAAEIQAVTELTTNATKLRDIARSIREYVQSLKVGALSPLTMGQKLAEAEAQYTMTLAKAQAGDATAQSAVTGKATDYLTLSKDYYASNSQYGDIFNSVVGGLEGLGLSLDAMAIGADTAAAQAAVQANYSAQTIAEMQRLRAGFAGVESVLGAQLAMQSATAAAILSKMTGPEQLVAIKSLAPEIGGIIVGALAANDAKSAAALQAAAAADAARLAAAASSQSARDAAAAKAYKDQLDLLAAKLASIGSGGGGVSVTTTATTTAPPPKTTAPPPKTTAPPITSHVATVEQWVDAGGGNSNWISTGGAIGQKSAGSEGYTITSNRGNAFSGAEAVSVVSAQLDANNHRAVYDAALSNGISANSLDAMMGWSSGTANNWAQANNLPQFAQGINHVPFDMTAQIHAGERILPAADNTRLFDILDRPTQTDGTAEEVKALRADVAHLTAVVGELLTALAAVVSSSADRSASTVSTAVQDTARQSLWLQRNQSALA